VLVVSGSLSFLDFDPNLSEMWNADHPISITNSFQITLKIALPLTSEKSWPASFEEMLDMVMHKIIFWHNVEITPKICHFCLEAYLDRRTKNRDDISEDL
jgi:hypothetical protein